MAVSFTALISSGYMFGWQILFSLMAGAVAGLVPLLRLLRHPRVAGLQERIKASSWPAGASYLITFQKGRALFPAFFLFFLAVYSLMLTAELGVLRTFVAFLFQEPTPETVLVVLMILSVCYGYVFVGGFRGVLVTDYFQLLVLVLFLGLLLASADVSLLRDLPPPAKARISWSPFRQILLHLGVFLGAFSWSFASFDQWYRTVGTLPLRTARWVLTRTVATVCVLTVIPVLAGSRALTRLDIPLEVTNDISLVLIAELLAKSNATLRFVFVMALTCAALTTLNTYIMTIQQLYYEFSIHLHARTHRWYLLEYMVKWKQVRGVGLLLTALCFCGSFLISPRTVYAFGVIAISGFMFAVPFLLAEAISSAGKLSITSRVSSRATTGLAISIVVFPPILLLLVHIAGPLSLHLYTIPAAAGLSAFAGNIPLLLVRQGTCTNPGEAQDAA